MRLGMLALAAACVALGLGPTFVVPALGAVAATVLRTAPQAPGGDWLTLRVAGEFASLSTAAIAVALAASLLVPLVALRLVGASRRTRGYETWGCGRIVQTARMEYTATAFANPFKRVFDFFYRPTKRLDIEFHPESRFFVERIEYENPTRSIFDDWLYRPALEFLHAGARAVGAPAVGQYEPVSGLHPSRPSCSCWCSRDRQHCRGGRAGFGGRGGRAAAGRRGADAQGPPRGSSRSEPMAAVCRSPQAARERGGRLHDDVLGVPRDAVRPRGDLAGDRAHRAVS